MAYSLSRTCPMMPRRMTAPTDVGASFISKSASRPPPAPPHGARAFCPESKLSWPSRALSHKQHRRRGEVRCTAPPLAAALTEFDFSDFNNLITIWLAGGMTADYQQRLYPQADP
jgi:hypothetical protein